MSVVAAQWKYKFLLLIFKCNNYYVILLNEKGDRDKRTMERKRKWQDNATVYIVFSFSKDMIPHYLLSYSNKWRKPVPSFCISSQKKTTEKCHQVTWVQWTFKTKKNNKKSMWIEDANKKLFYIPAKLQGKLETGKKPFTSWLGTQDTVIINTE